ncbi:argonaute [Thalictrum thalictroides]|uniref:Argonaute n=1 Tax=Thalictrum thalictroides TaxID=46969 RepID=A0A7J6V4X0_THATH|nr:argonaute [Thalictrum thalictroides]
MGIFTQCISPLKINDQYLTNVLLKINSKRGDMNTLLAVEHNSTLPLLMETPTMILGMDVSHGSPGQSDVPSIASVNTPVLRLVVGSRAWPWISKYRASVRTQSPKVEMIDSLFKLLPNGEDDGIIRELLVDFYKSSNRRKPEQIIIFRDGVSESQFPQVLNIELEQIVKAFEHLVAPICYAHLAAAQMGQFIKFEDSFSESSSSKGITSAGPVPVQQLPRLHGKVQSSMFFC